MKIVKIEKCFECPYYIPRLSACDMTDRLIDDALQNPIPDWCPLENAKKEKI